MVVFHAVSDLFDWLVWQKYGQMLQSEIIQNISYIINRILICIPRKKHWENIEYPMKPIENCWIFSTSNYILWILLFLSIENKILIKWYKQDYKIPLYELRTHFNCANQSHIIYQFYHCSNNVSHV